MIEVQNLIAEYTLTRGRVKAVDGLNIKLEKGQTIGLAGESGCGKSTLMKVIYGDLVTPLSIAQGQVKYDFKVESGKPPITTDNIQDYWFDRISYIPQNSMSALNPVVRIKHQFVDFQGLRTRREKEAVLEQVRTFIKKLDLPVEAIEAYPHQLSGGMRQRVVVALATFFNPDLVLADEPTTALDVVVQKGILLLLMEIQREMNNTILFVSHDMGVHYQLTHRMMIMYAAKLIEFGDSETVFTKPIHPYTKMLIESLPKVGDPVMKKGVEGRPPSLWDSLQGCRFAPRCPKATEECRSVEPEFKEWRPQHFAACHYPENL